MARVYKEKEIIARMRRETIGVLGTFDKNTQDIRMRVMYYSIDDKFNLYLMSTKGSPKIDQILVSPQISFMVFGVEDPYDDSWEVEINGDAQLLEDKDEIFSALNRLKDSNPFAEVAVESGITTQFDLIKLKPGLIRFRVYGEALQGAPPTVIQT